MILHELRGELHDCRAPVTNMPAWSRSPLDLVDVLKLVAATGAQLAQEKELAWHATLPCSSTGWGRATNR